MVDPLSVSAGLTSRLVLAGALIALVWIGVWWAA
jgi:hypothetical protein